MESMIARAREAVRSASASLPGSCSPMAAAAPAAGGMWQSWQTMPALPCGLFVVARAAEVGRAEERVLANPVIEWQRSHETASLARLFSEGFFDGMSFARNRRLRRMRQRELEVLDLIPGLRRGRLRRKRHHEEQRCDADDRGHEVAHGTLRGARSFRAAWGTRYPRRRSPESGATGLKSLSTTSSHLACAGSPKSVTVSSCIQLRTTVRRRRWSGERRTRKNI